MSWLSRLFGRATEPAPNTVVIDEGVATILTADGSQLEAAVNTSLVEHLEAKRKEAEAREARGIPFWLRRDSAKSGDIEDELRDRVIHRRSSEEHS